MSNIMFRYLEKYVGTYRVLPELDPTTNDFPKDEKGHIDPSYDDLYIPCSKGIIKHTYTPYYLAWYCDKIGTGRSVKRELENKKVNIKNYEESDSEVIFWFDDADIKKVAAVVKPKTKGKKISPFSSRNIGEEEKINYIIPENDLEKYTKLVGDLPVGERLKFGRQVIKNFDPIIKKKKGKNYNVEEERLNSGLSNKAFIHSIGMWNDFIKYIKESRNG